MANFVIRHNPLRDLLRQPASFAADLLVLCLIAGAGGALITFGREATAPYQEKLDIDLSLVALPLYTLFSLSRGLVAYFISLVFTLSYGTVAAHDPKAERLMIPALDVLQAIPVLGFMPGFVLAMIALFPTTEMGLEIACILMIFTGQVWNMTFSFHASLRSIPQSLREVAILQRLSGWQFFKLVEIPAAMIGLVWNSMLSMAGGWFFLTVNESFTLGSRDFRLPGVGSYMQEAITRGNVPAMLAAIAAMTAMIVLVDQLLWRPLVVWSQRFKMEETAGEEAPQSWLLNLIRQSRIVRSLQLRGATNERPAAPIVGTAVAPAMTPGVWRAAATVFRRLALLLLIAGAAWGLWHMIRLLLALPLYDAGSGQDWLRVLLALLASFLRTTSAVFIGAAWALPAGILIGLSARWSRLLQPVIQVVASFPAPMLFPLVTMLLLALHIPFTIGCVALMLLGAQWYILFNVIAGAKAIPVDLKEVAGAYRLGRSQRWLRLYVPCVFPYLVTGLVTAAGGAWNATIVAEYVQLTDRTHVAFGLGSMISQTTTHGNYPLLCAGVVTMAVSVVIINRLLWKRLYRLAESRCSLS